jgi:ribonuclease P protein subunit POP4
MSELLGLPPPPAGSIRPESIGSNAPSSSSMHPKLLKADFHGAVLAVKQSKNSALVGLSGILIHETENAFKLVTVEDKVKRELYVKAPRHSPDYSTVIPKENSIFTFTVPAYSTLPTTFQPGMPYPLPGSQPGPSPSPFTPSPTQTVLDVPHLMFELYGNQFRFRSSERAGRKFKHKESIELWSVSVTLIWHI